LKLVEQDLASREAHLKSILETVSISRTIIEEHGGQIWTEPNAGGGEIFKLTAPA